MQLIDRKRINNLPKFESGFDSNTAFNSINTGYGQGLGSNPMTSAYFQNQINGNQLSNAPTSGMSGNIKDMVYNKVYSLGNAFTQQEKFSDSTSNGVRSYGGAMASLIPGKYGQLAKGAVDITADTIGMMKYSHSGTQMDNEAGTTERTINGIGYTQQNYADTAGAYKDVRSTGVKNAVGMGIKGSAAGFAVGGPLGAVVGGVLGNVLGIFGGRKAMIRQKRINRNNVMQTSMNNAQQQAYADTIGLQNKYYQDNADTSNDILYANRGKDLRLRKRINNKVK